MKRYILLAITIGLVGCGDDNNSIFSDNETISRYEKNIESFIASGKKIKPKKEEFEKTIESLFTNSDEKIKEMTVPELIKMSSLCFKLSDSLEGNKQELDLFKKLAKVGCYVRMHAVAISNHIRENSILSESSIQEINSILTPILTPISTNIPIHLKQYNELMSEINESFNYLYSAKEENKLLITEKAKEIIDSFKSEYDIQDYELY